MRGRAAVLAGRPTSRGERVFDWGSPAPRGPRRVPLSWTGPRASAPRWDTLCPVEGISVSQGVRRNFRVTTIAIWVVAIVGLIAAAGLAGVKSGSRLGRD